MKLMSFRHQEHESFGAVQNDEVCDLGAGFDHAYRDLKDFLARGSLEAAADVMKRRLARLTLSSLEFLPVIPNPGKVWCCGLNYYEHVEECAAIPTSKPTFFLRFADSQVGHRQAIMCPRESIALDFEAEIAVIIGKGGRRISRGQAASHIAGYACYNDASVRDWQLQTTQWDAGKNFWKTGAFGPWMVTSDELALQPLLTIQARLNGQQVQRARTDMMIHDIASQIAYVSTIAPLEAGDVIVTGTPGGIGAKRSPPLWLKAGDLFEVEVEGIGTLVNSVADD